MRTDPLLNIQNLSFSYAAKRPKILSKLSLQIKQGSKVALQGPSGSGKTTLLRLIADLEKNFCGTISLLEEKNRQKNLAFMPQKDCLLPHLCVIDNVELPLKLAKKGIFREKSMQLLQSLGLDGFEKAKPKELSGGMRQRVSLASCLIQEKALVLLDEPFANLDLQNKEKACQVIHKSSSSFLIVSHDLAMAKELCQETFSLNAGKLHKKS